jgi:Domain of unknown function (DUF4404)
MADQELRELLENLHREIEHTESVDEKGQELLRHLGKDIDELLDRSQSGSKEPQSSTFERLEETIEYFEVTHPDLTMLISRLLDTLSGSGI